jgi:hypothetical protein
MHTDSGAPAPLPNSRPVSQCCPARRCVPGGEPAKSAALLRSTWQTRCLPPRRLARPKQSRKRPVETDIQVEQDISEELRWEPSVHAAQIGVEVQDGIVTLTGMCPDTSGGGASCQGRAGQSRLWRGAMLPQVDRLGPHRRGASLRAQLNSDARCGARSSYDSDRVRNE